MFKSSVIAAFVLVAVPSLARAGVDADVSNFELHLSKIDASLAAGDVATAQSYLRSAQRDVDTADDADLRDARFVKLKAKLPAYIKKVDAAASAGAQEHEDGDQAYLADQQYRFGTESLNDRDAKRAIAQFDVCISTLEALFQKSPGAKARPDYSNNMTNEKLLAACKEAKGKALAVQGELDKQKASQLVDNLGSAVGKYADGIDLLAKAKKVAHGGGKWAAFDGYNLYRLAAEAFGEAERELDNAIKDAPPVAQHVFSVGKTKKKLAGAAILAAAKQDGAEARSQEDALKSKHDRLESEAENAYNALPGARGKLARQHGNPSFFDGPDDTVSEALASAARAPYWRYDSDGCKTTYYFNGNSVARVSHEPAGCAN